MLLHYLVTVHQKLALALSLTSASGAAQHVGDVVIELGVEEVVVETRQQRARVAGRGDEDRSLGLARVEAERVEAAIGERQQFKAVEQLVLTLHQEVA